MARVGYLSIIGGMSGDMLLGAMLDAGLDADALRSAIREVVPDGWEILPTRSARGAITGTWVGVEVTDERYWDWKAFEKAVSASSLGQRDKSDVMAVLECLRRAESVAHGRASSHLHELGSTDTLIDIVGAVVGLRLLKIDRLFASPLPASVGIARSSHGVTDSFAPATMEIIREHRLPVAVGGRAPAPVGEAVTPTGAALLAILSVRDAPTRMVVESQGFGLGTRPGTDPPNVLGLRIGDEVASYFDGDGESRDSRALDRVANSLGIDTDRDKRLLEANIDDSAGELLGYAMERLFDAGAVDVWFTPIQMKKNRPAVTLSALVPSEHLGECVELLLVETSTYGVRVREVDRFIAPRRIVNVTVRDSEVRVKLKVVGGKVVEASPEFSDCREVALRLGLPLNIVMDEAKSAARAAVGQSRD